MTMDLTEEEKLWLSRKENPEKGEDLQEAIKPPMTPNSLESPPIAKNPPKSSQALTAIPDPIVDQSGDYYKCTNATTLHDREN